MAKVKLGLQKRNDASLSDLGLGVAKGITGNPSFKACPVKPQDIQDAAGSLREMEAEWTKINKLAQEVARKRENARLLLVDLLRRVGSYAESVVTEESELLAAGFPVQTPTSPAAASVQVTAPVALQLTIGDFPGQLDLSWDRVKGSKAYVVQQCEDPIRDDGWVQVAVVTRSRSTVKALTGGKRYWFRVAAVGVAGQGPFSESSTRIAP